jgi:hypothetical protein
MDERPGVQLWLSRDDKGWNVVQLFFQTLKPMKNTPTRAQVEKLKIQLREVRQHSLLATRQGDYRQVARLTAQAAALNKSIIEAEDMLILAVA